MGVGWGWEARADAVQSGDRAQAEAEEIEDAARRAQVFRAELGVSVPGLTGGFVSSSGGSGGASGGLGPLGPMVPMVGTLVVGVRVTPALWLFGGMRGGASAFDFQQGDLEEESSSWQLGGELGARLEVPLTRLVSVSGFLKLGASRDVSSFHRATSLSGAAGAGLHLRPTDLFGVRAELGVLDAGHSFVEEPYVDDTGSGIREYQSSSVRLGASPRIAMTFSF
jgi:hypothetical protein